MSKHRTPSPVVKAFHKSKHHLLDVRQSGNKTNAYKENDLIGGGTQRICRLVKQRGGKMPTNFLKSDIPGLRAEICGTGHCR